MKNVKVFLSALCCAMLLISCYPSDVLHEVPDGEFQEYLARKFDFNDDHKIEKHEALAVKKMTMSYSNKAKNLEGIKYFENLEEFYMNGGDLEIIDVSKNKNFKSIELWHQRELKELKLNKGIEVVCLCYQAPDIITFTSTESLLRYYCTNTYVITSIPFTKAPKLEILSIGENQITEIELSGFPNLTEFYCCKSLITTLDLSTNEKLHSVRIKDCPNLKEVWLKEGQQIEGINVNPDYKYAIDRHVQIRYK